MLRLGKRALGDISGPPGPAQGTGGDVAESTRRDTKVPSTCCCATGQKHIPDKGFSREYRNLANWKRIRCYDGGKTKPRVCIELVREGPQESTAGSTLLVVTALQCPGTGTGAGGSDAAAERGAVQPGRGASTPGLLVLLGQQQHEGHGQGAVVEAVHVGVVPLLQRESVRGSCWAWWWVLQVGKGKGIKKNIFLSLLPLFAVREERISSLRKKAKWI